MIRLIPPMYWITAVTLGLELASAATPHVSRAQTTDSLPLDTVLSQPEFPDYLPISLSPDGKWVAFTLQSANRPGASLNPGYSHTGVANQFVGCAVWIANIESKASIRISGGEHLSAWAPQWSPNGHLLAFYTDQDGVAKLWIWDKVTQTAKPASDVAVRAFAAVEGPRWTPDSKAIVTRILPHIPPPGPGESDRRPYELSPDSESRIVGATAVVYRTDSIWRSRPTIIPVMRMNVETAYEADLAMIDVQTGAVTTLAQGYRPFDYWVSPEGSFVAFTSSAGLSSGTPGGQFRLDLVVAPIRAATKQSLHVLESSAPVSQYGMSVAWSPNGRDLAYAILDSAGEEKFYVAHAPAWHVKDYGRLRLSASPAGPPLARPDGPVGFQRTVALRSQ